MPKERYIEPKDSQDETHPDIAQNPDIIMSADTDPNQAIPPITGQILMVGNEFLKEIGHSLQDKELLLIRQRRRVEIVAGTNEQTGQIVFQSARSVAEHTGASHPLFYPSDLPPIPLSEAETLYDPAEVSGKRLSTVRKHGASRAHHTLKKK